jgi:hypothetical protein
VGTFQAIVIEKADDGQKVGLANFDENNLMDGDVTVRVDWSTVNYKDGLAITGKAPVVRRFPMIPGIDLAGTVETSSHPEWKAGDRVVLNGWGLGETHLGAYAEKARIKGDWLVPLPAVMQPRDAMAIGTAGYTVHPARGVAARNRLGHVPAAAAAAGLEAAGQRPRSQRAGQDDHGDCPARCDPKSTIDPKRRGAGSNRGQNPVNAFRVWRPNGPILLEPEGEYVVNPGRSLGEARGVS